MFKRTALLLIAFLMAFSACAELEIVCSLFPQYDFTRRIAGERANVTKLLPDGMDSHGEKVTSTTPADIPQYRFSALLLLSYSAFMDLSNTLRRISS